MLQNLLSAAVAIGTLRVNSLHAGKCSMTFFFKINFFKNFFQEYQKLPSESQTVWIQIRPDILSDMIWVQTVCKDYQQMKLACRVQIEQLQEHFYYHRFTE